MHTIEITENGWNVVFSGARRFAIIAKCRDAFVAACVAAWLNGGDKPEFATQIGMIEWIGET